jgi:hypothetical protein
MPTSTLPTRWAEFGAVAAEALRHAREGHWAGLAAAVERLAPLQAELGTGDEPRPEKSDLERLIGVIHDIVQITRARHADVEKALDSTRRQQRMMLAYAMARGEE